MAVSVHDASKGLCDGNSQVQIIKKDELKIRGVVGDEMRESK
jgi:hypothetical protein